MKVLLTHERFPPDFGGGGEHVVLQTAHCLKRHGVDVRVLTTGPAHPDSHDGIAITRLPIHRYRYNLAAAEIVRHARGVDLIQTFTYHACLPSLRAGKRSGTPVVCEVLALFGAAWKEMRGPVIGRAFMAWERYLVSRDYARLVFLSGESRDLGIALGARPERSLVIDIGVEPDLFRPAPVKEPVVLFASKLDVRKGIHDVLAVARLLPDVRFRIIGWGDEAAALGRAAPANAEVVGFRQGQELRDAFGRASIFVLPSRAEPFGMAVLEAMAAGCAVISTVPLPFEGVRVPAGDRGALRDAVRRLWDDPAGTRRMGKANVERAGRYTWERYATALLAAYEEVLRA